MFDEKIFFVYYWGFSKNENKHTWFLIKHFQFSVLRVRLIFVDKVEGYRMSECDLWPKKEEIQKEITNIGLYPQNSIISWGILWNRMKTITESHVNEILCCLLQALPAVKYKPRHHTEDYSAQPSHLKLLIRKTCECLLVCNLMTCCYRFSCSRNEVSDLDRSPLKAHVSERDRHQRVLALTGCSYWDFVELQRLEPSCTSNETISHNSICPAVPIFQSSPNQSRKSAPCSKREIRFQIDR